MLEIDVRCRYNESQKMLLQFMAFYRCLWLKHTIRGRDSIMYVFDVLPLTYGTAQEYLRN